MARTDSLRGLLRTATALIAEGRLDAAEEILDTLSAAPDPSSLGPVTALGLPRRLHSARLKIAKRRKDGLAASAFQYRLVPPPERLGPLFRVDADARTAMVDAAARPVPRQLHQIWIGGRPPETTEIWGAHARRHGWSYSLWDEAALAAIGVEDDPVFRHMIARGDLPGAVDVARYHVLWRDGGLYLDCDWLPVRPEPPERVLPMAGLSAMAEETPRLTGAGSPFLNNSVIAAPPAHPVFRHLVDSLPEVVRRLPEGPAWWVTGPLVFTLACRAGPICVLDAGLSAGTVTGSRADADTARAAIRDGSSPAYLLGWKPWDEG